MGANTKIEWTDHSWNPWTGCTKVSPGCDHCYAEGWAKRSGAVKWGAGEPRRRTTPANWRKPLQWEAGHSDFMTLHNRRQRVFCSSLADVFDNAVDPDWRVDLLDLIRETPHLDWLVLTKRVGNVRGLLAEAQKQAYVRVKYDLTPWIGGWLQGEPPANVWLGATVVNQEEADRDIPKLLAVPARVRFLSIEPMLGPISFEGMFANARNIADHTNALEVLDWIIVGGESGPKARPMHPDWARSLRDQCAAAGVPFLFKQWGEWAHAKPRPPETPGHFALAPREFEGSIVPISRYPRMFASFGCSVLERIGKKAAGRLLDGIEHNGFPA